MQLPWLAGDVAAVVAGRDLVERQIDPDPDTALLVRVTPYRDAEQRVLGAVVTFVDVTSLRRAEERLRVLVAELQHRTRNLLGVVQAIARRTIARGGALDAFLDRLSALGRVQGLISGANGDIDLGELIRLEVLAHGATPGHEVTIAGPAVGLPVDDVQAVALVVHELATNAVKHGALHQEGGCLTIGWAVDETNGKTLVLDWEESGVTMPPEQVGNAGFGLQLIQRSMQGAMRATTQFSFGEDGVRCHIELPLGHDDSAGEAVLPGPRG